MSYETASKRLDKLHSKNTKCPYCKAVIPKFVSKCDQCGVSKKQIDSASWQEAKEITLKKRSGKIVYTKSMPKDLDYTRWLVVLLLLGWTGLHNFWIGRRLRGWIIFGGFVIFFACFMFLPMGSPDNNFAGMAPARAWFVTRGMLFPADFLGAFAVIMWFVDWGSVIIFRNFKYPVHLRVEDEKKPPSIGG